MPPSQQEILIALESMSRSLVENIDARRNARRLIEIALIILSAITTCSVLVLIFEKRVVIITGIASFITTILTGYLALGPTKEQAQHFSLLRRISRSIGAIRDGDKARWPDYKDYWAEMIELGAIKVPTAEEWARISPEERQAWEQAHPQ